MRRIVLTLALLVLLPCAVLVGAAAALVADSPVGPRVVAPACPEPLLAAEAAFDAGDALLAVGFLSQVPEHSRDFARAQRWIAHRAYTTALGRPEAGLRHALRACRAAPLEARAWQDAARTAWAVVAR